MDRSLLRSAPLRGAVLWLLALALATPAAAQNEAVPSEDLKNLTIEELMEIDVTSVSRRSEPLSRAAAAVTVITREEIRRSGATSLPEALRLATSLHVARFDSRTWAISARGFNIATANKMLVMIDGRSVYTPLFSGVFWDVQDVLLDDVERIEIIRGPGATLWGANAVNGVINVITRSAGSTQGGLAYLGTGSADRAMAAVRYGGALGESTRFRTYAKYRYLDALALSRGGSAEDPLRTGQGGFRVDSDSGDRDTWTLQGDLYKGVIGELTRSDTDVNGGNLLGRFTRRFSEESGLELQVYWDRTHRRVPTQFEEDRDTWDVDFQHRLPFGERQDLVWGLGLRVSRDDVRSTPVLLWVPGRRTQELWSAFAQDEISLSDDLTLTVGSKFEVTESTGLEVQPSARLAYVLDDRRTLWGAISRAVRTPTRIDEDSRFLANGTVIIQGSRDFESEDLLAYELGYRYQPVTGVSLDAATFYNVYDDLRSQEPPATGAPFPITLGNRLNAETWGVEVRANYQAASWWQLFLGYAWFDKDLSLDPDSRDPTGGVGEGNDPENRFSLRSLMDLPRGFELDTWIRYVDDLPSPAVPAYTEMDLRLGWRRSDRLEISLVGQNLLHDQHGEFFTALPKEVERSVYGKVTWRF